jgi:phenylpropionate dioxygenase-like ring-hydroxylating dioxygenase large terminal subunit
MKRTAAAALASSLDRIVCSPRCTAAAAANNQAHRRRRRRWPRFFAVLVVMMAVVTALEWSGAAGGGCFWPGAMVVVTAWTTRPTSILIRPLEQRRCKRGGGGGGRRTGGRYRSVQSQQPTLWTSPLMPFGVDRVSSSSASLSAVSQSEATTRSTEDLWNKARFPHTWVPLASVYELNGNRPNSVYFLGREFIVYQGRSTENPAVNSNNSSSRTNDSFTTNGWVVTGPTCPHRLAPLSEGRIVPSTRELECSYHGWTFDGTTGVCTQIPQLDDTKTIPKCTLPTFPSLVVKNVLWTWPWPSDPWDTATSSTADINTVPLTNRLPEFMLSDVQLTSPATFTRDLPYGYDTLLENIVDPSHVPFAHHGLQGTRSDALPILMTQPQNVTINGFDFDFADRTLKMRRNGTGIFRAPFVISYASKFLSDNDTISSTKAPQGRQTVSSPKPPRRKEFNLTTVIIPTQPGWSRIIIVGGTSTSDKIDPPKQPKSLFLKILSILPVWLIHQFSNRFLDSDLVFLHHQEQEREARRHGSAVGDSSPSLWNRIYFMPAQSDRCILALRQWVDSYLSPHLLWPLPRLETDRRRLFDRWTQHSEHCQFCNAAATKMLPKWRNRIYLLLAASVLAAPRYLLARVALVASLGLLRLYQLADQLLRQGEYSHHNNH